MTNAAQADRAWMTPLLNRIADVAGERAALILGTEKAGQQIYIPVKVDSDHWLAGLISYESALALVGVFGGNNITIPPVMAGDKRRRARALADLIARGYSINKIVSLTGVARSTVIEHRARNPKAIANLLDEDDDQGKLL
ncbi:hypothetical protein SAMN05892877_12364 [Rhizobium subbaraonis]|uniref:Homeodomain-like domain-containing protein n=1 Tax=Rhizobium subbaraonis TaxID=908946 RepID=A0A285UXV0_9HYPH|nr:hypothetical protein [Rhizobium subbaraonis]SOC46629.1 hypothetical protein SAMN05892877_12364 [Rhizobium subbaraonis]